MTREAIQAWQSPELTAERDRVLPAAEPLPAGCTDSGGVTPEELHALLFGHADSYDNTAVGLRNEVDALLEQGCVVLPVGLRRGDSIVAHGRLTIRDSLGWLSHRVVRRQNAYDGLDCYLVSRQVHLAEELGVITLMTEETDSVAVLSHYKRHGFSSMRGGRMLARTSLANLAKSRVGL